MIAMRMVRKKVGSIVSFYSISFYNDDYKQHHPFANVVQVEFEENRPSGEEFRSFFKGFHTNVTGTELWYKDYTGYISFSDARSKTEALASNSNLDFTYPYSLQDYERIRSFIEYPSDARFPFSASVVASYRPSLHSVDLIRERLSAYGFINGSEVEKCPYDEDRAFLYCNFQNKVSLKYAIRAESIIAGYHVGLDSPFCSNVRENVEIMKNVCNEHRRFSVYVNVMFDGIPRDNVLDEVRSHMASFGEIDIVENHYDQNHDHNILSVKYKYPISVYRIFYERTMFGRVCTTLAGSGTELKMVIPQGVLSYLLKHLVTLELNEVVLNPGEDVTKFCYDLLDSAGCNPGVISGVYLPLEGKIFLKLAHPWYVRDVSQRLYQFLELEQKRSSDSRYRSLSVKRKNAFWSSFRKSTDRIAKDIVL